MSKKSAVRYLIPILYGFATVGVINVAVEIRVRSVIMQATRTADFTPERMPPRSQDVSFPTHNSRETIAL